VNSAPKAWEIPLHRGTFKLLPEGRIIAAVWKWLTHRLPGNDGCRVKTLIRKSMRIYFGRGISMLRVCRNHGIKLSTWWWSILYPVRSNGPQGLAAAADAIGKLDIGGPTMVSLEQAPQGMSPLVVNGGATTAHPRRHLSSAA